MRLENFHVEVAEWSREQDREALQRIRQEVFVIEQRVPEARERDGLDATCWHVLAYDDNGHPIGCGRLTLDNKIGRMAVLRNWRGQGVGVALLRELVERARMLGRHEVALAAQVTAIGFYERAGFHACGDTYEDAGLQHRDMKRLLSDEAGFDAPARDIRPLPAGSRSETAQARLQVLGEARHQLSIYLPRLDSGSFDGAAELAEIQRVAISGRSARIRIVLHDPAAALHQGHRLVALAQRLPSFVQIRTPIEETDMAYTSAYLLNDTGGYLFLPEADRPQGRAALDDRAAQAPLGQHFDNVWERAERATILQTLDI